MKLYMYLVQEHKRNEEPPRMCGIILCSRTRRCDSKAPSSRGYVIWRTRILDNYRSLVDYSHPCSDYQMSFLLIKFLITAEVLRRIIPATGGLAHFLQAPRRKKKVKPIPHSACLYLDHPVTSSLTSALCLCGGVFKFFA